MGSAGGLRGLTLRFTTSIGKLVMLNNVSHIIISFTCHSSIYTQSQLLCSVTMADTGTGYETCSDPTPPSPQMPWSWRA